MADNSIPSLVPNCTHAVPALDAITRARNLARGINLALCGLEAEYGAPALAVAALVATVLDELAEAEIALSPCIGKA